MSEQGDQEKKVVHRIEPKQQPIVLPSASDSQTEEGLKISEAGKTPHFQQYVSHEEDIENDWGRELSEDQKGRRKLLAGVVAIAVFFLGCAIWALLLINSREKNQQVEPALASAALSFDKIEEIRNTTVAAYLGAATLEEKARYVRDPERVFPLMEEYYKKNPLVPEQIRSNLVETPVTGRDGVLWRVKAREKDANGSLYLLVETKEDGRSLVDWETDVIHQPSDWDAFIKTKSTVAHEFRAMVRLAQLDGFHGFEFSEYSKFRCFKVTHPDSDGYLWAYTEIGSKEDARMQQLIASAGRKGKNRKRAIPVILELRYPENGQSARCVHLHSLVRAGWLH